LKAKGSDVSGLQELIDAAGALARELQQLRGHFEALDVGYGCDWVDRELEGYAAGLAVPRYRQVPCATWGELASAAGRVEIAPLPTAHLRLGNRAVIREGVRRPEELAGRLGVRYEGGAFLREIDPQSYPLYLRGMAADRAGWRVLRAWESVPVESLLQMLRDAGAYGNAMHEDAVRRQG
jgi:hypothetical protein